MKISPGMVMRALNAKYQLRLPTMSYMSSALHVVELEAAAPLGPHHHAPDGARHGDRAEHRDQDTDDQHEGKAADHRRALPVQPRGDQQGADVRVEDARPGPVEARLDRRTERLAEPDLLLHPLEDEDVRVHR